MSGSNTKSSKVQRILERITELGNSLKLAMGTIARLEAENARLRKYLGGELFKRRLREMQIPTLQERQHCSPNPLPHNTTETV